MNRFSAESLEPTTIPRAATDEDRPGRPRRLSNGHREERIRHVDSPELNLLEECRRRVKRDLSTRFFGSLEELTTAVDGALDQLSGPDVNKYL
jgi:hypothetical protein